MKLNPSLQVEVDKVKIRELEEQLRNARKASLVLTKYRYLGFRMLQRLCLPRRRQWLLLQGSKT